MTKLKAITGNDEQVHVRFAELIESNSIEMVNGLHHFEIIIHNDDLFTLVWMPKERRQRRKVSTKQLNERAAEYNLHIQRKNEGFEIIKDRGARHQVAFAKTVVGIQRKLTKEIKKIDSRKIELICFNSLDLKDQIAQIESGEFSYN